MSSSFRHNSFLPRKKELFKMRWEKALDLFVAGADYAFENCMKVASEIKSALREEDFKDLGNSLVFKVTIAGIILTLSVILMSCQTMGRRMPFPPPPISSSEAKQNPESVYVKRDSMQILPKDITSEHGSIYAQNKRPLQLFSEDVPQLPGDYVVIQIPEHLIFKPQPEKEKDKDGQAKIQAEKGKQKTDEEILKLLSTDPAQLTSSDKVKEQPIKELKVQIIGFDQSGRVFLKGVKQLTGVANGNAGDSSLMITASIPATALKSKNILATDLSQIEVSSMREGKPSLYQTDGWDLVVSRKLAGFSPDLDADLQKLKEFQKDVAAEQLSLTERFRGLKTEQSRFKREQAAFMEKMRRASESTQSQIGTQGQTGAPGATQNSTQIASVENSQGTATGTAATAAAAAQKTPEQQK